MVLIFTCCRRFEFSWVEDMADSWIPIAFYPTMVYFCGIKNKNEQYTHYTPGLILNTWSFSNIWSRDMPLVIVILASPCLNSHILSIITVIYFWLYHHFTPSVTNFTVYFFTWSMQVRNQDFFGSRLAK